MSSRNWDAQSEEDNDVIVIHQQLLVKAQRRACVFTTRSIRKFTCAIQLSAMNTLVNIDKVTYINLIYVLFPNLSI